MTQCPKCKSEDIHRSRAKSRWENWRKEITGRRPFRCRACGWRGWGVDVGPKFGENELEIATRALAPDPPNLKSTALVRDEQRAGLDLQHLDSLEPIDEKRK